MNAYSKSLKEKFCYKSGDPVIVFESGVEYTLDEINIMDNPSTDDTVKVHMVKEILNGEVTLKYVNSKKEVFELLVKKEVIYHPPKFCTLGGYPSENAFIWNDTTISQLNDFIQKLSSTEYEIKKQTVNAFIEFKRNFMLDTWYNYINDIETNRKKYGLKSLETLLILALNKDNI